MKRTTLLILLTALTVLASVRVSLVQLPAEGSFGTFCIDDEGWVYQSGQEDAWKSASSMACPSPGPYDICAIYDELFDRILLFVIAGDGAAYIVGPEEWIPFEGPGVEGTYRISGSPAGDGETYFIFIVDEEGVVKVYGEEGWTQVMAPVEGPGPYDIHSFSAGDGETFFLDVINGEGRIFRATGLKWYEVEVELDGAPPYAISAFNKPEAAYHFVTDSSGSFWMLEDGFIVNEVRTDPGGTPPYHHAVYINPVEEFLAVLLVDSRGVVFDTDGEAWQPFNKGFDGE